MPHIAFYAMPTCQLSTLISEPQCMPSYIYKRSVTSMLPQWHCSIDMFCMMHPTVASLQASMTINTLCLYNTITPLLTGYGAVTATTTDSAFMYL